MAFANDFILGSGMLYQRFRLATEILCALSSAAPRPLTMGDLIARTGGSDKQVARVCSGLERAALLRPATGAEGCLLALPASAITLEDIFRCALDMQAPRGRGASAKESGMPGATRDLDLLLMQATMAINQSVFRHLRQFSLDRLKTRTSPVTFGALRLSRSRYDDNPDFALMA
jgi:DNA-binding IscR family transcriptional regulator